MNSNREDYWTGYKMGPMRRLLQDCIENFGAAPRRFSWWDRLTYLPIPKPRWLRERPTDGLRILFQNAGRSFSEGVVVWGHIVQANRLMFSAGNDDCPGELVYSIDDSHRIQGEDLQEVAGALGRLKGQTTADGDLLPISRYLADGQIRVFGLPVPRTISPTFRCQISTTFLVRKHLPGRRLCKPLLPVVVNPGKPHVAMPLPAKYWPDELSHWWKH